MIVSDEPNRPATSPAALIAIKAVPGSRKTQIVGPLGDRLKVKVAAPPEDGKANAAICELIAGALGLRAKQVTVVQGHSNPEKVVRVEGLSAEAVRAHLQLGE
ncbi:MAG: DUF167 domain-containing protein [Planctomycetota bacterium]